MAQCAKCGTELQEKAKFCSKCGLERNLDSDSSIKSKKVVVFRTPLLAEDPRLVAAIFRRFLAFFIDSFITILLIPIAGLGFIYFLLHDSMKGGQSVGKRMLGLKVINYETHRPANCSESFGRNCGLICAFTLSFNSDGRHISDLTAGTMVIMDS